MDSFWTTEKKDYHTGLMRQYALYFTDVTRGRTPEFIKRYGEMQTFCWEMFPQEEGKMTARWVCSRYNGFAFKHETDRLLFWMQFPTG